MPSEKPIPPKPKPKELEMEHGVTGTDSQSDAQVQTTSRPNDDAQSTALSSRTSTRSPPPGILNMTGLRSILPDIALNSPSTNIIGTPFAHTTSNTPFEYPFPETPPDSVSSSSPPHPAHRPGSPHGNFQPPPHPHPPADAHSPGSSSFNLFHSRFKAASPTTPPPIPPSLKKKRWTLNILNRRRTSNPPTPAIDGPSSPPGSPPAVPSGAVIGGLGSGRPRLGDRSATGGTRSSEDSGKSPDKK